MSEGDGWGEDAAVHCFLSYHTDDSEYWRGLGPKWKKTLTTHLRTKLECQVQVYEYSELEGHFPGDWRNKIENLVRACDVFIALVTDRYLDAGHEAIAIELGELMHREEGVAFPIFITERRGSPAWVTEYADWIFRQDGCSHKLLMSSDEANPWNGSGTPRLPRGVSNMIAHHIELLRAGSSRATPTSQLPVQSAISDALAEVYAMVGLRMPASRSGSLAQLQLGAGSPEQLRAAAEELAVLLDERASDEVIQAWAKSFLA